MQNKTYTITVNQPYFSLLELEAKGSRRSSEAHILHILGRRYDNLRRICTCGYFIYSVTDDLSCTTCSSPCCPYCSIPQDDTDLCFSCAKENDIDTKGRGGFRAAPEGKV